MVTAMHRIIQSLAVVVFVLFQTTKSDIIVYRIDSNQIIEEFHDLPARFGATFPINGLRVLAVQSNPSDACSPIVTPPSNMSIKTQKWAVVIARGNCSFEDKVRNAQKAGYSAAIVHNINSNDLEPMSANNDEGIDIPSMFVGEMAGKLIIYNYLYVNDYALVLNGDLPFNINTNLIVPFSIIVGLCFLVMVGFMIMKCIREQRRLRRHRLPGSALKKIPIIRFTKDMTQYETCAICIEDYVDGDRLRVLPCGHAYHNKCIDPWLTKNRRVCPICKRKVFARDEPRRRRRRSTDDSMSDSDHDDTTPLLNPVDNSHSHGTFSPSAPPTEDDQSHNPNQRFNPFNRHVEVQIPDAEIADGVSIWIRIKRAFRGFHHNDEAANHILEGTQETNDGDERNMNQSQSSDIPIASYSSSSSNNVMNANLSGSLKRFNRQARANIHEENSDDDDDDENGASFHECHDTSKSIFAPISLSQPTITPSEQQPPVYSRDEASTSHQRIAVAALPNADLDPMSSMSTRTFSASTPTMYSHHQSSNAENSDENGRRRRDFTRNTTASSSNYFV